MIGMNGLFTTFIFWRLLLWVSPSALFYLLGTLQGVLKSAEWSRSLKIPNFFPFPDVLGFSSPLNIFSVASNWLKFYCLNFGGCHFGFKSQEFLHQLFVPLFLQISWIFWNSPNILNLYSFKGCYGQKPKDNRIKY